MKPLPESRRVVIGEYRALAELGEGAMGMVFLARGPGGELAALKRIHPHLLADTEFRARFRREVDASRKVDSAWAAPVIDADTEAAEPWFASAFVPGPTLAEVLAAGIRLPEPAVLRLAAGLAAALVDFAAAGVIHRDLKPSNILLAADGPRVLDFGIARAVERGDGTGLTRTGWVLGTPAYMSPEQARAKPVTAASDVFSVGSVLVAAYTGSGPFDDPETLQTMFNVVHAKADVSGLPPRLRRIVTRCLAKQPRQRPDAGELAGLAGDMPATDQAWPPRVQELLAESLAALAKLRDRHPERTTLIDTGPTLSAALSATVAETQPQPPEPATAAVAEPAQPEFTEPNGAAVARTAVAEPPAARAAGRGRWRFIAAAVAAAAAVLTSLLVFGDGERPSPSDSDDTVDSADSVLDDVDFADAYRDYEPDEPDGTDSDANEAAVAELPDPCSTVGSTVIDDFALTGGEPDTRDVWKSCSWLSEAASEPAVLSVSFAIAPYTDDDGGEPAVVTGAEDVTLHRDEKPGSCTVQWPASFGHVLVTGAGDEDSASLDACGLAVDFAEEVAPDLPR